MHLNKRRYTEYEYVIMFHLEKSLSESTSDVIRISFFGPKSNHMLLLFLSQLFHHLFISTPKSHLGGIILCEAASKALETCSWIYNLMLSARWKSTKNIDPQRCHHSDLRRCHQRCMKCSTRLDEPRLATGTENNGENFSQSSGKAGSTLIEIRNHAIHLTSVVNLTNFD